MIKLITTSSRKITGTSIAFKGNNICITVTVTIICNWHYYIAFNSYLISKCWCCFWAKNGKYLFPRESKNLQGNKESREQKTHCEIHIQKYSSRGILLGVTSEISLRGGCSLISLLTTDKMKIYLGICDNYLVISINTPHDIASGTLKGWKMHNLFVFVSFCYEDIIYSWLHYLKT